MKAKVQIFKAIESLKSTSQDNTDQYTPTCRRSKEGTERKAVQTSGARLRNGQN